MLKNFISISYSYVFFLKHNFPVMPEGTIDPFTVPSAIYWNSDPANMIARLGLSSREIQTAVLVAFRWKEILLLFKMVLKYRDKAISSLEDIQNLTAKDLREIL